MLPKRTIKFHVPVAQYEKFQRLLDANSPRLSKARVFSEMVEIYSGDDIDSFSLLVRKWYDQGLDTRQVRSLRILYGLLQDIFTQLPRSGSF